MLQHWELQNTTVCSCRTTRLWTLVSKSLLKISSTCSLTKMTKIRGLLLLPLQHTPTNTTLNGLL